MAARQRESRSQIVYTRARGREMVFWQSARTRKQSRPGVRMPTARAAGIAELEIVVDSRERYAYDFAGKPVRATRRTLPCGDYGLLHGGRLIAAVERKSLDDLTSSLLSGKLKYQLTELAALPRAAVVVEERYSQIFAQTWARPATVADSLAELQTTFSTVSIQFCDNRKLAQEHVYRYLAAVHTWAQDSLDTAGSLGSEPALDAAPAQPEPSTAEIRAWARSVGLAVPDRGKLPPEIRQAWDEAHASG